MYKKLVSCFVSLVPFNILRIFLYRLLLGYEISYSSKIGWGTIINCRVCKIRNGGGGGIGILNRIFCDSFYMENNARIKNMNVIVFVKKFVMAESTTIASHNKFIGARKNISPYEEYCNFSINSESIITNYHHFDIVDMITIGRNVVFGGIHSSVWTHGFDIYHVRIQSPVTIGDNIYIGSGVTICQGVSIAGDTVIGAGTVVSKNINTSGFYISSQLTRKSDISSYSDNKDTVTYQGYKFHRKI
jgi:acetyltransferase-like isoleucine patch superfamily enzyme